MEKSAFKAILISFIITMMCVMISSCQTIKKDDEHYIVPVEKEFKYITVIDIKKDVTEKQVLVTTSTNKALKGGATGALLGAGASYLLGGSATKGAMLGGAVGLATTGDEETVSYYETRFDVNYTVVLSDSSTLSYQGWCPYKVGENVKVVK